VLRLDCCAGSTHMSSTGLAAEGSVRHLGEDTCNWVLWFRPVGAVVNRSRDDVLCSVQGVECNVSRS
jgi:hypothetical protein